MTKPQDGVPQIHNGVIELPRFHVKESRDTARVLFIELINGHIFCFVYFQATFK